jgi:ribosome-associated heat shock protein Hsp15
LERQRLDKWLWHARVVKARTSAAALVEAGHVRINGVREKSPGHGVKAGDVLTIGLDYSVRILKVTGFAEHRGDATSARVLYDDLRAQDPQHQASQDSGHSGPRDDGPDE